MHIYTYDICLRKSTFYLQMYQGWMSHIRYSNAYTYKADDLEVPTKYLPLYIKDNIYMFDIVRLSISK